MKKEAVYFVLWKQIFIFLFFSLNFDWIYLWAIRITQELINLSVVLKFLRKKSLCSIVLMHTHIHVKTFTKLISNLSPYNTFKFNYCYIVEFH